MPDSHSSHSDAEKSVAGGPGPGYGLPNKAAPLPRQWQMPPPQGPLPHGRNGMQHFYPGPAGAGGWRPAPPRRMERAILLGLWLLVMLAAVAIGMRMLDLSAVAAPPVHTPPRPLASDDAANAITTMRSGVLAAARSRESDPFDDAPPDLSPAPAPLPEPVPVPEPLPALTEAPARPAPTAPAAPAAALAVERPAAPPPALAAPQASRGPVCADALRAMQLCPDMK